MYLSHFHLNELPFGITPDTKFIYCARTQQEALNTLVVAMESGEGFVKVTGEVGTGKTLLCRRFLGTLGEGFHSAYIPNPQVNAKTLLLMIAEELGADGSAAEAALVIRRINQRLLELAAADRTVVLCIDEAQMMPPLTLESLRLLSNLETEKRKLIHIILFGQPELDEMLATKTARALRQRIAFHYRLSGLGRDELDRYLEHRLHVAGYRGDPLFSSSARRALYYHSGGTPRLVNILAHKAMLAAFGGGRRRIGREHVITAARDTEGALRPAWWKTVW